MQSSDASPDHAAVKIDTRYAYIAAGITLSLVFVMLLCKSWAWVETGATSVLASLLDSLMDVGISAMNLMVIRFALKPADEDHRYGHGKAEGIAALFQAAFITGIAVFLLLESVRRFLQPEAIESFNLAIAVMTLSMLVSVVIVTVQKLCLKKAPSLAVDADSAHYTSDIFVNGGTIITLLALKFGAPLWADPLFAVLIVIYLLFTVRDIGGKAVNMLMDRELPDDTRREITRTLLKHKDAHGVHDLRTREVGMRWNIAVDVEMDPHRPLCEIHKSVREMEEELIAKYPQAEVMIHMDPVGDTHDSRHPEDRQKPKTPRKGKPKAKKA